MVLDELFNERQEAAADGGQPSEAGHGSLLLQAPSVSKFKVAAPSQQQKRVNSTGLSWSSLRNKDKMKDKMKAHESGGGSNVNEATAATKGVAASCKPSGPAAKKETKDKNQLLQIVDIISDGDLDERPTSFRNISIHSQMAQETALKQQQQTLAEVDAFMDELKLELENEKNKDHM